MPLPYRYTDLLSSGEDFQALIAEFSTAVESVIPSLTTITETASAIRAATGAWSKKEILGHLIDSASNNHQRFVRAQMTDNFSSPGYEQEFWVTVQNYQSEPWATLVEFWQVYNLNLVRVISNIPADKLHHKLSIGGGDPVTLEYVIRDYVGHLKHHLRQILN